MEYRQLGRSGLKVSTLTLGTMTFGGKGLFDKLGNSDVEQARRLIDMSMEAGVNSVDTADLYSSGVSEEIVGQAIAGRRNDLVLATKVRFPTGEGVNDQGLSRHHIIQACEASLQRLKTSHIDVYWLHGWDGQTPVDETMQALSDLTRDGKIRYVGVSNFSSWHVMKALAAAERANSLQVVGQQIYYSLQSRDAEYELLPLAVDQQLASFIWSPLAGGLLSGKYRRGQPMPEGSRMVDWKEPPVRDIEAVYDVIEVLVEVAERRSATPTQVALAWLLTRPSVASIVIGARNEKQLTDNLKAAELQLTQDDVNQLEKISRQDLIYPYWHQLSSGMGERFSEADLALFAPYLRD